MKAKLMYTFYEMLFIKTINLKTSIRLIIYIVNYLN